MPLWLQPECQSLVARKWKHLFWARRCNADLRGLFSLWAHWTKFHRFRELLQQHCQTKRRNRFRRITTNGARAADNHDSKALYEAVRELTPKQLRRSIRFRGPNGQVLSPEQELNVLCQHFQEILDCTCPVQCAPGFLQSNQN